MEIGSNFWNTEPIKCSQLFFLSGRTALDFIIRDIIKTNKIKSVLMPSYCCHTMIEPFFRHGIDVRFYDVYWKGNLYVDIPEIRDHEIFYYMSYFGFSKIEGFNLSELRKKCEVMIEDMTHVCIDVKNISKADYSYTSFRKWAGLEGVAIAKKHDGIFSDYPRKINQKYLQIVHQAMKKKQLFIEKGLGDKKDYLDLFSAAEKFLESDYIGYVAEDESIAKLDKIDWENVIEKRKNNARVLLDGLLDLSGVLDFSLMFRNLEDRDVPLFLPIIVNNGQRDELRKYLIEQDIYCPIHWPISPMHKISDRAKILYNCELSLICDQRYGIEDMRREIEVIRAFYRR